MNKDVDLGKYLQAGIFPLKKGFPKRLKVFSCDTETADGIPYMLQFYDGKDISLFEVDRHTVYPTFMQYLKERCVSKGYAHIVFFHNLEFDISAILDEKKEMFQYLKPPPFVCTDEQGEEIGRTQLWAQKTWFGKVKFPSGLNVSLVDSTHFVMGSLYDISRKLDLPHKKPKRPKGIEEGKEPQSLDDHEIREYVEQEILAEYDLAMYIIDMHKKYDAGLSISSSDFSAKVFKKHFLRSILTLTVSD